MGATIRVTLDFIGVERQGLRFRVAFDASPSRCLLPYPEVTGLRFVPARSGDALATKYLHSPLQCFNRGWYWNSEQFREYLLKKVDAAAIRRNRNYQSAQMGRDHGQAEAEKIVQKAYWTFRERS